jgi:hypothetical protein
MVKLHEDNIIFTFNTQGTNNNKYEETEKCVEHQSKSNVGVPQATLLKSIDSIFGP